MEGMYNKKKAMSLHRRRKALLIIILSFFILMKDIYTSGTEKKFSFKISLKVVWDGSTSLVYNLVRKSSPGAQS